MASLPPTRSRGSSEIDPKPAAQRDRAGVSIGTSTTYPPSRVQRESSTHPHVPCERRTDPAEPTQTRSAAGSGRSERWNVHHLLPSRLQRESPTHPHVPCERRTGPAEPTQTRSAAGPGRSEHWNVHHLPPSRLQRESPTSSPRSLRAQDRSRGAHPNPSSAAGPGRSERRNVHHLPTLARSARKPNLSPRSLRTQDRSRGAHPQTHPPMLAF